jgi:hypothetical protein
MVVTVRQGFGGVDADGSWLARVGVASSTGRDVVEVDWAATPLGAASDWPIELQTLVQLCLTTRFPMLLTWGPELQMIYNDGYRDMIGAKHPAALGASLPTVWPEIWDVIGPLVDRVMRTGEPTWSEHERLLIDRRGFVEETYFTFSFSPALDCDGKVAGIVDVATETTEQVIARRRLVALTSLGAALLSASRVTDVCVAAMIELARWGDDIVRADVFLLVEREPVLIASTGQLDRGQIDAALLRDVAAEGEPRVLRADTALAESPPTGVVLPIAGDVGDPRGVLVVEPSAILPYTVEHEAFLVGIAANIAGALRAAQARAVELGEQRHISEVLQQAMLRPATDHPTVAARYRPLALNLAVGGDWYDVIDLDEHRRAMVVGDCVGHGLDAAAVMGQLRSATRTLLLEGHGPAKVLERLDNFSASLPGAFATSVICVIVDRLAATLSYSRAGHVPPLLVGRTTSQWLDDPGGTLLQVLPGATRPMATLSYTHGDLLVLYSDGLIERRRESLDVGLARLESAARRQFDREVSIQAVADGLLRDLLPLPSDDDVVLVTKRLVIDRP